MNMKIKATLALAGLAFATQSAFAIPQLTGYIGFDGSSGSTVKITGNNGNGGTVFTHGTTFDFDPSASNVEVNLVTGNLAAVASIGDLGTFVDFTFDPLPGGGYIPLWTLTTSDLQFDLTTITSIVRDDAGPTGGIDLEGTGTLYDLSGDYLPTTGHFTFRTSGSRSGVSATTKFTFQSSVAGVPDGGATAMLLGLGLLGIAGIRRKMS